MTYSRKIDLASSVLLLLLSIVLFLAASKDNPIAHDLMIFLSGWFAYAGSVGRAWMKNGKTPNQSEKP